MSIIWILWLTYGAFFLLAAMLAAAAVFMLLTLRETPGECGVRSAGCGIGDPPAVPQSSFRTPHSPLQLTLSNPALWLLAVSLGLLNACRFGFLDWGVAHLKEVQGGGVSKAAVNVAILPLGGILGAYLAGWASDRYFRSRRAPVIAGLLFLLGLLTLTYDWVARRSLAGTVVVLALIGAVIFGPQVLLVGTAPADLARRGTAAAAAGFVDFVGYMGAFAGDRVTGLVAGHHGWRAAIVFWASCAFAASFTASLLWNATGATRDVHLDSEHSKS